MIWSTTARSWLSGGRVYLWPAQVAGATLMALGCNGPELSLNTKLASSIRHPRVQIFLECRRISPCFTEDPWGYVGTSCNSCTDKWWWRKFGFVAWRLSPDAPTWSSAQDCHFPAFQYWRRLVRMGPKSACCHVMFAAQVWMGWRIWKGTGCMNVQ